MEGLGYSVGTMPDHFNDQFAPVPALQCVLDATTTLRAGALVFDNDYKHPLVLAKELATMDVLSDGRVEIGLGAGWMAADYEQAGMQYDRAGVRIDRFVEGLAVIKGIMGAGTVLVRRRALHDHRLRRTPQAGPVAVPADPDRRRRQAGAVDRRSRGRHRRRQRLAARRGDRRGGARHDDRGAGDRQRRHRRRCRAPPRAGSTTSSCTSARSSSRVTDDRAARRRRHGRAARRRAVDDRDDAVRADRQRGPDRRRPDRASRAVRLQLRHRRAPPNSTRSPPSSPNSPAPDTRVLRRRNSLRSARLASCDRHFGMEFRAGSGVW